MEDGSLSIAEHGGTMEGLWIPVVDFLVFATIVLGAGNAWQWNVNDELERENHRLAQQNEQQQLQIRDLKEEVSELADERECLALELRETKNDLDSLLEKVEALAAALAKHKGLVAVAEEEKTGSLRALEAAQREVEELKDRLATVLADKRRVRAELLGLRGKMRRVVVLLDASGSMGHSGRWEEAMEVIAAWLAFIDVEQVALLVFNSEVQRFPEGGYLNLQGPDGELNRERLSQRLQGLTPEGRTDTLTALRKAYKLQPDTIFLFTDGAPNHPTDPLLSDELLSSVREEIYQLCREHPGIPVNTVGLCDYFDETLSKFLQRVASLTGGTYRGR